MLQDIVDEVLAQGVWIMRVRPSIRLTVAALSRKPCERAAGVIKAAITNVLAKRNALAIISVHIACVLPQMVDNISITVKIVLVK